MEETYIPLSYLAQYGYCPRRAALLLLESAWEENEYTAQGRAEHERVHNERTERRRESVKLYDHALVSERLGLRGKSDCIEAEQSDSGVCIFADNEKRYVLYPIEYKHGRIRNEWEYHIQLCAEAMCLEEMYGGRIERGAVFYITAHRRIEVIFDETLRNTVNRDAEQLHKMLREQIIPKAVYGAKCVKCSLYDYCLPKLKEKPSEYLQKIRRGVMNENIDDAKEE